MAAHWTYLYDNIPEDFGGGFVFGEFVLLTDGRLFRRRTSPVSQWILEEWAPRFKSVEEAEAQLARKGYDLSAPGPVPVTARSAPGAGR